jgi:prevent-host-death family protein
MKKATISAADANREFSAVLRGVRTGHSYVVTSHGRPVARIVPVTSGEEIGNAARETLFKRLEKAPALAIPRYTRDELYEDDM